jgi:HAD superfamily hydrolase (TIGR01509 family)
MTQVTQAVIFDCFGVLTTDAWLPFKKQHFGNDPELFARAGELNKQSDSGLISTNDFVRAIGEMVKLPAARVAQLISNNVPNDELFEYLRKLKATYKIGLLSNTSDDRLKQLFGPEQLALFDAMVLSYETHLTKPMPEAYEAIAERLGVAPNECIFIDDQERFVTGAREADMPAIWYQDNDQLERDLTAFLADPKH